MITSTATSTSTARIEHANLTVSDPDATAARLVELFDWRVRWSGAAKDAGYTVHVGTDHDYLALYTPSGAPSDATDAGKQINGLNHVGLVVDDLDDAERRVRASGLEPFNFGDYEPGRRFYFVDPDGVEFEIVSYST